jgi:hypothetical protein
MSDVLKTGIKLAGWFLSSFGIFGCTEKFSPNLESDPIPVVYAVIDPDDSLYCIRLTKTFLCTSEISDCAKDSDIQYFPNPIVELELLSPTQKLLNRARLEPRILDPKIPGLFSVEPNIVYAVDKNHFEFEPDGQTNLFYSNYLVLKINTNESPDPVYAQVEVRNRPSVTNPRQEFPRSLGLFEFEMEKIGWRGYTDEFHNVVLQVQYTDHYYDSICPGYFETPFSVDPSDTQGVSFTTLEYPIDGSDFLRKINIWFKSHPTDPELEFRKITSLTVLIRSISDDYRLYMNSLNHDSDFEIKESYNIINGIGLFAVKREGSSTGHSFNLRTLDSIANSKLTRHLKFVKW